MAVRIRKLKESDFEGITELYSGFFDELKESPQLGLILFDKKPSVLDGMKWFLEFEKACAEGNAIGLVAVTDGVIVGFSEVDRRKPNSAVSHRGDFGINVRKDYRGKGIGTRLLKEMIKRCKGSFEVLELEVFVGNQVAKHPYEKFGFKTYGRRPMSVRKNGRYIEEELMYLKL